MNSSLIKSTAVCFFVLCLSVSCTTSSSTQPLGGLQTKTGFDKTLTGAINGIAAKSASAIDIPTPKDAGGGYTHEQHKDNAKTIYNAGQLYKITGEDKYAVFVRDLLLSYAKVYPDWGFHPAQKEQSPGRMSVSYTHLTLPTNREV